jgi:hypothetical protein
MPTEAIIALGSFVALAFMWVVLPTIARRRQQTSEKDSPLAEAILHNN